MRAPQISPSSTSRPPHLYRSALSGLCALLVGIGLGRFAFSLLTPLLVQTKWFTAPQADYLGATNLAGYLAGSVCAERLARHFDAVLLIKTSLLTAALCFFACCQPVSFPWFFIWRFLSGFAGGILMILASSAILAGTPKEKRARIAGILFTGVGAGIAVSGTLVPLFAKYGVTTAWLSLGLLSASLTAFAWKFLPGESNIQSTRPKEKLARIFRPLWLLLIAYVLDAIGFVPHTVFWVDYIARGLQKGIATGAHYWLIFGLAAACGPMLSSLLASRIGTVRSLPVCLVAQAIAVALPCISTHSIALCLSSVGVGSMAMGMVSLTASRVAELVAPVQQKQVWGWMTAAFSLVYAAGGYLLSFVFAQTESYLVPFSIGAFALLFGALLLLFHPSGAAQSSSR